MSFILRMPPLLARRAVEPALLRDRNVDADAPGFSFNAGGIPADQLVCDDSSIFFRRLRGRMSVQTSLM